MIPVVQRQLNESASDKLAPLSIRHEIAMLDETEKRAVENALNLTLNASTENPALFAVEFSPNGLQLVAKPSERGDDLARMENNAIRVDFLSGAVSHRRKFGGGQGQLIARAVGIGASRTRPSVLDATAGLGKDAFVLASLGCSVTLIERVPILAALLRDGLRRAEADSDTRAIVQRMRLVEGDAVSHIRAWPTEMLVPQVVYLDPMFPVREKSALVKKEMRFFHHFFAHENNQANAVADKADEAALLSAAWALASHRVVVKRPRKAPVLLGALGTLGALSEAPSYSLDGKSCRFDIYAKKSFKSKLD